MIAELIVLPEAEHDIVSAYEWYESHQSGLGRNFISDVDHALRSIIESPESRAQVYRSIRIAILTKFPYVISYDFDGTVVRVFAVLHGHRDSKEWQQRIP